MVRFLSAARSLISAIVGRCLWLGVLGLSAAACGGSSVAVVTVTRPTRAVWCPTIFHGQTSGMSTPNPKVPGSFDTRVMLGHPEASAAAVARKHGCSVRVVNRGGALTADGRPDRIDVDVSHRIVTATGVG